MTESSTLTTRLPSPSPHKSGPGVPVFKAALPPSAPAGLCMPTEHPPRGLDRRRAHRQSVFSWKSWVVATTGSASVARHAGVRAVEISGGVGQRNAMQV